MRGSFQIHTDGRVRIGVSGAAFIEDATYARFGPFQHEQGPHAKEMQLSAIRGSGNTTTHSAKEEGA